MLQPPQGPLAKALRPEWTETGNESWGLAGPMDSGCTSPFPLLSLLSVVFPGDFQGPGLPPKA